MRSIKHHAHPFDQFLHYPNFLAPWYLLVLLLVPVVLAFAIFIDRRSARHPVAFTNLDVLASVAGPGPRAWRRWVPLALLLLAVASAIIAVARPRASLPVTDNNATIGLLVDVSGSMQATDVEPTRLDAAKQAMVGFVNQLPKQAEVGLSFFSTTAETAQDPTRNHEQVEQDVTQLQPLAATAIGDGILTALSSVKRALRVQGYRRKPGAFVPAAIILLSDGAQSDPPYGGRTDPLVAAARAKAAGVRIYTVSLGTQDGVIRQNDQLIRVPPSPATMQGISSLTGGKNYTATSADQVANIYGGLGSTITRHNAQQEISAWFAILAAGLLVAAVALARIWDTPLP